MSNRIDVRKQRVAKFDIFYLIVVPDVTFLAELPRLAGNVRSVRAEKRIECAELEPSGIQFLILLILKSPRELSLSAKNIEASYVRSPVRYACERNVQSRNQLFMKDFPRCRNITRPYGGCIALLGSKRRTGKNKDSPLAVPFPQTRIEILHHFKRIRIEISVK